MIVQAKFNSSNPSLSSPWHLNFIGIASEADAKSCATRYMATLGASPDFFDLRVFPAVQ